MSCAVSCHQQTHCSGRPRLPLPQARLSSNSAWPSPVGVWTHDAAEWWTAGNSRRRYNVGYYSDMATRKSLIQCFYTMKFYCSVPHLLQDVPSWYTVTRDNSVRQIIMTCMHEPWVRCKYIWVVSGRVWPMSISRCSVYGRNRIFMTVTETKPTVHVKWESAPKLKRKCVRSLIGTLWLRFSNSLARALSFKMSCIWRQNEKKSHVRIVY